MVLLCNGVLVDRAQYCVISWLRSFGVLTSIIRTPCPASFHTAIPGATDRHTPHGYPTQLMLFTF